MTWRTERLKRKTDVPNHVGSSVWLGHWGITLFGNNNLARVGDNDTCDAVATPACLVLRQAKPIRDRTLGLKNPIPMRRTADAAPNDKIIVTFQAADVVGLVRKGKSKVLIRLRIQAGLGDCLGATAQQQQQE